MAFVASKNSSNKEWVNAPQGMWNGVICDVQDLGLIENKTYGKMQHKCLVMIQLEPRMEPTEQEEKEGKPGRRHLISKRFTVSLANNSMLLPFVEGIINRHLTEDEKNGGYDLETLIGLPVLTQVIHAPDEQDPSQVWANIHACLPQTNEAQQMQVEDYIPKKDRPADGTAAATPAAGATAAAPAKAAAATPAKTQEEKDLNYQKGRLESLKSAAKDLGIPMREVPAAVLKDLVRLTKVNDAMQGAIVAKQAELKAAEPAAPAENPAEDDGEDFDPLATDSVDDDPNWPKEGETVVATDTAKVEVVPVAKEGSNKVAKGTVAAAVDQKKSFNPDGADDEGTEGEKLFDGNTPAAAAKPAAGPAVTDEEAWIIAKEEAGAMSDSHQKICFEFAKRGADVEDFNENTGIVAAINAFRASTNKKPIASVSELTNAAASTTLARIIDGTIEVPAG